MKMNLNNTSERHLQATGRWLFTAGLLASAGWFSSCKDTYDLDEKLPPNFGSNLMTYLEKNNFTNYAQLAKDLGYEEDLSGVSLKTLIAADDDAFKRFYENNDWGVTRYEDLTEAQKKMLLNNTMLTNSLQLLDLSSSSGQQQAQSGNAMRRDIAASVFDSVPTITPDEMPKDNPNWSYYKQQGKSIVCMKDMSPKPIVFFLEPYLRAKGIEDSDIEFVYNNQIERAAGEPIATIGSTYFSNGNIRQPNGFIHQTKEVLVPMDNMSEVIRKSPLTQQFSRILERFSAPFPLSDDDRDNYNRQYKDTPVDTLFEKRYFSERSRTGAVTRRPNEGQVVNDLLTYDPGWNRLESDNNAYSDGSSIKMQSDMVAMLVPSDQALKDYWDGDGRPLKVAYGEMDSVPNRIWVELINNGMLNSFTNSVLSKFEEITNSDLNPMHMDPSGKDIEHVYLACNGAVYVTNKVFAPTSFESVCFPPLANETMSIFNWAIKEYNYRSYLNSLGSYFSFFVPTNGALLQYADPANYLGSSNQLWEFHYDETREGSPVWARVYDYDIEKQSVGAVLESEVSDPSMLKYRLQDLLDNHIVIGNTEMNSNVENGHNFYRTKNGGIVEVKKEGSQLKVRGTYLRDNDKWLTVTDEYTQKNGKVYILDQDEAILTTRKGTLDVMSEQKEDTLFFHLLASSSIPVIAKKSTSSASSYGNLSCFNNYNYTIYVPKDDSLKAMLDNKAVYDLYTWEEIDAIEKDIAAHNPELDQEEIEEMTKDKRTNLERFIRYHIQDNLLMLGLDYSNDGGADFDENGKRTSGDKFTRKYETAFLDDETGKFQTLTIDCQPASDVSDTENWEMTITDKRGNKRHVLKRDKEGHPLYNLLAREYEVNTGSNIVQTSSFAVIHYIDGPLYHKK